MQKLQLSLTRASVEFSVSRDTIQRGLSGLGIAAKDGQTYTIGQLYRAIAGDLKLQRTRETKLRADLLELELAQQEGRLLEPEIVTERINKAFGSVRQAILSGRAEVPPRANPQDHVTAMTAWLQWEERFFPYVRESQAADAPLPFPPPPDAAPAPNPEATP